jgi:aldehyde:ferredoxin oxidoreductase
MNKPIPDDGPAKGAMITQDELDLLLDDYYQSRGWTADGIPTKSQLDKLGMEDLFNIIEGKGA